MECVESLSEQPKWGITQTYVLEFMDLYNVRSKKFLEPSKK